MLDVAPQPMTADQFLAWAMARPEGERYELCDGEVIRMAPERSGHSLAKGWIYVALLQSVRDADVIGTVFPDGMAVRIDDATMYEPDVMLRLGPPLPFDALVVTDPVVIVEVLSPSTGSIDAGVKLSDYFRMPSLRHYLVADAKRRRAVHHRRDEAGTITTKLLGDGPLQLDPPGLVLPSLFSPA